jgi:Trypsin-co-occurring domain 1
MVAVLARIPLEGGGAILVEAPVVEDGPVKAGRVSDAIRDLPTTLQSVLAPVTDAARVVLEQLRRAKPSEVEVEFGVNLATEAGAVITRSEVASHLVVKLTWRNSDHDRGTDPS